MNWWGARGMRERERAKSPYGKCDINFGDLANGLFNAPELSW